MKSLTLPKAESGFGVELEFHVPQDISVKHKGLKFLSKFSKDRYKKLNPFTCIKGDCSCGKRGWYGWDGLEINLGVFSLDRKGIKGFDSILDGIYHDIAILKEKDPNCKNPITRTCGFHVHVSRGLFKQGVPTNFLSLWHKYQDDIFQHFTHPCRMKSCYVIRLDSPFAWSSDHGSCLNYSHHPTYEIRHMGMTSSTEALVNWVKFIYLMVETAQDQDAHASFLKSKTLLDGLENTSYPAWFEREKFLNWARKSPKSKFPVRIAGKASVNASIVE